MNRALLLAAAGIALTGCYVENRSPPPPPPAPGALTFYWSLVNGQGQTYGDFTEGNQTPSWPGCAEAAVDQVRITISTAEGDLVWTTPCEQRGIPGLALSDAFLPGDYPWTLEGLRGGVPVYEEQRTARVFDGQETVVYGVLAALYYDLNVFYDLPNTVTCAGVNEIGFRLYTNTNPAALVYGSELNITVPCDLGPGNGFVVPSLPAGSYFFHYVAALNSAGESLYQVCNQALAHSNATEFVTYLLNATNSTCP